MTLFFFRLTISETCRQRDKNGYAYVTEILKPKSIYPKMATDDLLGKKLETKSSVSKPVTRTANRRNVRS